MGRRAHLAQIFFRWASPKKVKNSRFLVEILILHSCGCKTKQRISRVFLFLFPCISIMCFTMYFYHVFWILATFFNIKHIDNHVLLYAYVSSCMSCPYHPTIPPYIDHANITQHFPNNRPSKTHCVSKNRQKGRYENAFAWNGTWRKPPLLQNIVRRKRPTEKFPIVKIRRSEIWQKTTKKYLCWLFNRDP